MRIRTQFLSTLALFGIILIVIVASLFVTRRQVEWLAQQQELARNMEREASELGYLSNEYLLYHEPQQRVRWESTFAAFSANLSQLNPNTPEQQALASNIKANQQRLKAVFADIAGAFERGSSTQSTVVDLEFIRVPWSRMEVQTQGIVFDASRLSQMFRRQVDESNQTNLILVLALIGMFGAYLLANYLVIYRRTLRSITELQAGTSVVGSGNLDFAIPVKRADEIGELARAFNRMTTSLKAVTASKADLEREIAERKRAEAERERLVAELQQQAHELAIANKELEAFSYSVSHDLRAPLRAIDGFSHILIEQYATALPAEARRYVQMISDNARTMIELVDSLLRLSRLSRQALTREAIAPADLARAVLAEVLPEHAGRRIEVSIGDLPSCLADRTLLHQVFTNLLGNALKFTRTREVATIEIGCREVDGQLVYFVKDNGVGFDMRYGKRLFEPFQRLHRPEDYEGTGVGLAIVQRIVQRHGGSVWAEAALGEGATFCFTL